MKIAQATIEQGDRTFSDLMRVHRDPLIRFFYRRTQDRETAEDCVQEVFCRIYQARAGYQPTGRFRAYLYRVARNLWIDRFRREMRRPRFHSLERIDPVDFSGSPARNRVADLGPTPSENVRRREVSDRIDAAIGLLPSGQRQVFRMSENEGLRQEEIARRLEIPVGTVKSRMHTAIRRLRQSLRAQIETP
jgi:RNA polymerase sigma-70 factor (ECF subfamily)